MGRKTKRSRRVINGWTRRRSNKGGKMIWTHTKHPIFMKDTVKNRRDIRTGKHNIP